MRTTELSNEQFMSARTNNATESDALRLTTRWMDGSHRHPWPEPIPNWSTVTPTGIARLVLTMTALESWAPRVIT